MSNDKHSNSSYRAQDPVCGMTVDINESDTSITFKEKKYYFCSENCLNKFSSSPPQYLKASGNASEHAKKEDASTAQYTCPMHPEIVRKGPGSCPKCGMALEPVMVSLDADDEGDPEYNAMRIRMIIAAILTVPLVIIAMRHMIPGGISWRLPPPPPHSPGSNCCSPHQW